LQSDQLCGVRAKAIGIAAAPAIVNVQVPPDLPTGLLQRLLKGQGACLCFGAVSVKI
jgi:hypothetical protein